MFDMAVGVATDRNTLFLSEKEIGEPGITLRKKIFVCSARQDPAIDRIIRDKIGKIDDAWKELFKDKAGIQITTMHIAVGEQIVVIDVRSNPELSKEEEKAVRKMITSAVESMGLPRSQCTLVEFSYSRGPQNWEPPLDLEENDDRRPCEECFDDEAHANRRTVESLGFETG